MKPQYAQKAFTLIELLVVVSIIAILASILLPALSKAREKSRQSLCASNFKQCGLALVMYADDQNGRLPHQGDVPNHYYYKANTTIVLDLETQLDSYIGSFSVWQCGSVGGVPPIGSPLNYRPGNKRCNVSYFSGLKNSKGYVCNPQVNALNDRMIMAQDLNYNYDGDGQWRTNHSIGGDRTSFWVDNPTFTTYKGGLPLGTNILLADGRVEWRKADGQVNHLTVGSSRFYSDPDYRYPNQ